MKWVILLVAFILLPHLTFAYICDDSNSVLISNIPCEGITPASMTCSDNVSIINLANYSDNRSNPMFLKIPASSQYNFTFSYNVSGQYLVTLCNSVTAIITVTSNATIPPTSQGGGGGQTSWQSPGITGAGYNITENITIIEPVFIPCGLSCKADNLINNLGKYVMNSSPRIGFIIELILVGGIVFLVYRVRRRKVYKPKNTQITKEKEEI